MSSYSNLPGEVIEDILYRVPVKTVGRCRCLSKSWRSQLSRPDFIKTHLNWSKIIRPESLLLISKPIVRQNTSRYALPLYYASSSNAHHLLDEVTIYAKWVKTSHEHGFRCWVLGSCDGLLLVANCNDEMFALNPITNEIRIVPESPFIYDSRWEMLYRLEILYGFGYDDVRGEYKVVIIYYNVKDYRFGYDNAEMFVNIFSLKTGTWNKAESSPCNHAVAPSFTPGAFLNGCIHWFGLTTDLKPTIVAFDMAREKFLQVSPPPSSIGTMSEEYFGYVIGFSGRTTLDGCLCAFNEKTKDVWVMKEYDVEESWTKLAITNPKVVKTRPICMFGQEAVVLQECKKLLVYHLKEHTVKDIVVDGIERDLALADQSSFVESLVSPHGANETMRE